MSIIENKDKHLFYNFCTELFGNTSYRINVVKTLTSRYHSRFKVIKCVIFMFDLIYLPLVVWTSFFRNKFDLFFFREFNTLSFPIIAIFIFPLRHKILLNVNHNFQRCITSSLHARCIRLLDMLGFRLFNFESGAAPLTLNRKVISVPFPLHPSVISKPQFNFDNSTQKVIGVVGSIRDEKNIPKLLEVLNEQCSSKFDLVLGCDDKLLLAEYNEKGWITYNTSTYTEYLKAIGECDVLVFNYSKYHYQYRHSGVLTDAILKRKIVVAPDYPYFSKQLNYPHKVGVTFKQLESLYKAVEEAVEISFDNKYFDAYLSKRSMKNVSQMLDIQLKESV